MIDYEALFRAERARVEERRPVESLLKAPVSPLAKRCIEALYIIYPGTISRAGLTEIIYRYHRSGGPEYAVGSIAVTMHKANKVLKRFGWRMGASAMGKRDDIGLRPIQ